jgi:hypothetical protein
MPEERAVLADAGRGQDWLAVLDAHRVEFLILDAEKDCGLLRDVKGHPGWTIELQDGDSVFLCRTPASAVAGRVA